MKPHVKNLRTNMTEAEKLFWSHVRNGQLGVKFRRQVPIDHYICDFLCFEKRLVVEIDGGQHAEQTEADAERTRYLAKQGYQVIRFWNNDVLNNIEGVLGRLQLAFSQDKTNI